MAALFVHSLFGCSSGGSTKAELHAFNDDAGRACQATLEKTSPTAPVVSESVSCDSAARQCSSESVPCFELNIDAQSYQIRNCAACCKGSASSFVLADCNAVLCTTDSDCVYAQAKCVSGACTCPQGYCD
ncbi:MAG TPA: hypothetical protein VNG33_20610 [Polyangiaceae bacterium]|nr:hypothetical protein [Polyangiaceae bacterium]